MLPEKQAISNTKNILAVIYTTTPSEKEAKRIAKHLLGKKLAACVVMFPVNSLYWWKGKIEESNEFVLLAKTPGKNFKKAKKEIEKIHPYKISCILKFSAESTGKYFGWVLKEVE